RAPPRGGGAADADVSVARLLRSADARATRCVVVPCLPPLPEDQPALVPAAARPRSRLLRTAAAAAGRRRRVGGGAGGAVRRIHRLQPARAAAHPLSVRNGEVHIRGAGVSYRLYGAEASTTNEAVGQPTPPH